MSASADTPVALFLFNRPDKVRRVFDRIRQARPRQLFVIADGPRPGRSGDAARCAEARAATATIDWPCHVERFEADHNLGVKERLETGLAWVFDHVEAAVVLEDDCVPDPTLFAFHDALIDRYRHDDRVATISSARFVPLSSDPGTSYVFSRFPLGWGWSTWRRAWRLYDASMRGWPSARANGWLSSTLDPVIDARYWTYIFETNWAAGDAGHWDHTWLYTLWRHDRLAVHPAVNLVTNIGFDAESTHTRLTDSVAAHLPTTPMPFPLRHPVDVAVDADADRALDRRMFSGTIASLFARLARHGTPR
jgi:hypothetical protein